jgi:hypothetical protein
MARHLRRDQAPAAARPKSYSDTEGTRDRALQLSLEPPHGDTFDLAPMARILGQQRSSRAHERQLQSPRANRTARVSP